MATVTGSIQCIFLPSNCDCHRHVFTVTLDNGVSPIVISTPLGVNSATFTNNVTSSFLGTITASVSNVPYGYTVDPPNIVLNVVSGQVITQTFTITRLVAAEGNVGYVDITLDPQNFHCNGLSVTFGFDNNPDLSMTMEVFNTPVSASKMLQTGNHSMVVQSIAELPTGIPCPSIPPPVGPNNQGVPLPPPTQPTPTIPPLNPSAPTVATTAAAVVYNAVEMDLSVLGADSGGEANLIYVWNATGPATVVFSSNGTNVAKNTSVLLSKYGNYVFEVAITNAYGMTVTSSISATVSQVLTRVVVTPANAGLTVGGTQQFTATAVDQFGSALVSQPSFVWSKTGSGTLNATGLYTASSITVATITATTGSGPTAMSATAMASVFSIVPTITSATPNVSSAGGIVTLTGTNLTGVTSAKMLFTDGPVPFSVTVNSATSITLAVPPAPIAELVPLYLIDNSGTMYDVGAINYILTCPATVPITISPNYSPYAGGITAVITGSEFLQAQELRFGNFGTVLNVPGGYVVNSDTQITVVVPPRNPSDSLISEVYVLGYNDGIIGQTAFTYGTNANPAPPVVSSCPATTLLAGGAITITGSGFAGVTSVGIDFYPGVDYVLGNTNNAQHTTSTYTINSDSSITVQMPTKITYGTANIVFTNPAAYPSTQTSTSINYVVSGSASAPFITSITPVTGAFGGGTVAHITGTNFSGVTSVVVVYGSGTGANYVPVTSYTVNSSTLITATMPASPLVSSTNTTGTGNVSLCVTTANFNSNLVGFGYTHALRFDRKGFVNQTGTNTTNKATVNPGLAATIFPMSIDFLPIVTNTRTPITFTIQSFATPSGTGGASGISIVNPGGSQGSSGSGITVIPEQVHQL